MPIKYMFITKLAYDTYRPRFYNEGIKSVVPRKGYYSKISGEWSIEPTEW